MILKKTTNGEKNIFFVDSLFLVRKKHYIEFKDLNNFRLLFELRAISVGIIITRTDDLQEIFDALGRGKSFGASTTHMAKLLPKIHGGGGGGCPVLVFGIKKSLYVEDSEMKQDSSASIDFINEAKGTYKTILADPPWRFQNSTGKVAPEHKRLARYPTLALDEIINIPVNTIADDQAHLYLWIPNALLSEGLQVMKNWGFTYKTNIVWFKIRKDGGPDGRGVGFYFRNVTELVLFGVKGKMRTLQPGRSQTNIIQTRKREHSRKPDELYDIIESCSPGPYLEMFARGTRKNWAAWGNQTENYFPDWPTYQYNSTK